MITKAQIDEFYNQKQLAVIGVSRNKKKFGYLVYNELKTKGYDVVPVNKNADTIDDAVCFNTIDALPAHVKAAIVLTPKKVTLETVQQLIQKGIKQIWVQQNSDTPKAISIAKENNVNLIYGKCIFMFSEPVAGIHKFHRTLVKIFGGMPK